MVKDYDHPLVRWIKQNPAQCDDLLCIEDDPDIWAVGIHRSCLLLILSLTPFQGRTSLVP